MESMSAAETVWEAIVQTASLVWVYWFTLPGLLITLILLAGAYVSVRYGSED